MSARDQDPPKRFRTAREARQIAGAMVAGGIPAAALEVSYLDGDLCRRVHWVIEVAGPYAAQYVRADGLVR